jgi:hypothetical protein
MVDALSEFQASDEIEYRSVDPLAIVALVVGLISPLALGFPILVVVPIVGALVALAAVARIGRDAWRSGRAVALVGLALSSCFLVAPLARYATAEWLLPRQARPVADRFLELLQEGRPEEALLLQFVPDRRPPVDAGLWTYYRNDLEARMQIHNFVQRPGVRMLLALGDKAQIRFYNTNAVLAGKRQGLVEFRYTVTFEGKNGRRQTMLLGLLMERKPVTNGALNPWRVRELSTTVNDSSSGLTGEDA